jgi:hypothetical protein
MTRKKAEQIAEEIIKMMVPVQVLPKIGPKEILATLIPVEAIPALRRQIPTFFWPPVYISQDDLNQLRAGMQASDNSLDVDSCEAICPRREESDQNDNHYCS